MAKAKNIRGRFVKRPALKQSLKHQGKVQVGGGVLDDMEWSESRNWQDFTGGWKDEGGWMDFTGGADKMNQITNPLSKLGALKSKLKR